MRKLGVTNGTFVPAELRQGKFNVIILSDQVLFEMADPSYGSLSYRPHGPLIRLMIECSDRLNGSESILGKKFSKSNFLTFSLEATLHTECLLCCLSDAALFLFSKRGSLLLCVESLSLAANPNSSFISCLLGLSQDGQTVAFTELRICQLGEEPRVRTKSKARRNVSSWAMCECLEFCWGQREGRGRDWRLDLMEHWSLGINWDIFILDLSSLPRILDWSQWPVWCGGPKRQADGKYKIAQPSRIFLMCQAKVRPGLLKPLPPALNPVSAKQITYPDRISEF